MVTKKLYWRNPTKEEKRFGQASIHYREFEKIYCLNQEGKLHLSIISIDDKQRYFSAHHEYLTTKKFKPRLVNI